MKIVKEFREVDLLVDVEFKIENYHYGSDLHVRTFLEKHFGMAIIQAYRQLTGTFFVPTKTKLRWDASSIVLFLTNGNVVEMENSEWATFKVHQGKQPAAKERKPNSAVRLNCYPKVVINVGEHDFKYGPLQCLLTLTCNTVISTTKWPKLRPHNDPNSFNLAIHDSDGYQVDWEGVEWQTPDGKAPLLRGLSVVKLKSTGDGKVFGEVLGNNFH